jgi:DNA ligase 1
MIRSSLQKRKENMKIKEYPVLYGLSSTEKQKMWQIRVVGEKEPAIKISHGYVDGKIQTNSKKIKVGKNIGRSNETSAFEQACSEAQALWTKKKDKKYSDEIVTKESKSDIILPMLAQKFKDRKHNIVYPCYVQPKLNGVRCLAQKNDKKEVKYLTRGGKEYTTLSHLTKKILDIFGKENGILDGEIFVKDWSFQEIVRNVKKERDTTKQLQYWVYDFADPKMTFTQRLEWISKNIGAGHEPEIILVPTFVANNEKEVYEFHKKFVNQGFEGVIIRNTHGKYIFDHRSKDLQKYKTFEDAEFKILGGEEGTGLEEGCIIFICNLGNGKTFKVRPKGSRELRKEWLKDLKNIIGKDLTVRYQEFSEEGVPIFPVGIAIRDYE